MDNTTEPQTLSDTPDPEGVVLDTLDSVEAGGAGRFSMARYIIRDLTRAGLLVTPEHDAEVAERAWDEGWSSGFYRGVDLPQHSPVDASEIEASNPYESDR